MKGPQEGGLVRTLAVIPARAGSKGIPNKNVADLCGHPLIWYAIRAAHASTRIDATIVSTDSEEIASVARALGADVPFLRPTELATDSARDIGYLQHALEWVERERGWKPEIILFLAPTSPSRTSADIDAAVAFLEETGADSVRTMIHDPKVNPYKMWKADGAEGKVVPIFPEGLQGVPRQECSACYIPVAIAYVTRAAVIRAGNLWGDDVRMMPFSLERATDIDTPEDMEHAANVLKKFDLI